MAALKTLQAFPFFRPTCLCKEPGLDPECNNFRDFLFDHPCGMVSKRGRQLIFRTTKHFRRDWQIATTVYLQKRILIPLTRCPHAIMRYLFVNNHPNALSFLKASKRTVKCARINVAWTICKLSVWEESIFCDETEFDRNRNFSC